MIAVITGKIIEREPKAFIVDVHGIGYRVYVGSQLREQAAKGSEITLQIHHHISEDRQDLYGFADAEELRYFTLLLTVPSVGAKTARNILDIAPPRVLDQAVADSDVTLLTKVSGIGKKTAQRIVVELQEKLKAPQKRSVSGALQHETMEALVSIGYTTAQARIVVSKLPKDVKTVEEAVKAALRVTSNG